MRSIYKAAAGLGFGIAVSFVFSACIPASITRIGPPRPAKPGDCEVKVLPPGETPDRPWVDIGAVHLENCQEYHVGLCRTWLIKKACALGGEIAYLPNPEPPEDTVHPVPITPANNTMRVSDPADGVNFHVLVAVYAVDLTTPFPGAPGCKEPAPVPNTDTAPQTGTDTEAEPDTTEVAPDSAASERCME